MTTRSITRTWDEPGKALLPMAHTCPEGQGVDAWPSESRHVLPAWGSHPHAHCPLASLPAVGSYSFKSHLQQTSLNQFLFP